MGGQIHMTEAVVVCRKFWEVQFDILSHYHHYHTHTLSLSSRSLSQYVSLQYHIHQHLISPPHHRHTSGHPEIDAAPESR